MKLRLMLVLSRPDRAQSLIQALEREDVAVVASIDLLEDLPQAVARHGPDLVLIEVDLPTPAILDRLQALQTVRPCPVAIFAENAEGEMIRRAVSAGVTACVVDGSERRRLRPILEAAIARFEQLRALEDELSRTRSQLEDRKVIERAKGILMKQQGLSESDAYQAMRRLAMQKNRKLVEIAEGVLTAAALMGG